MFDSIEEVLTYVEFNHAHNIRVKALYVHEDILRSMMLCFRYTSDRPTPTIVDGQPVLVSDREFIREQRERYDQVTKDVLDGHSPLKYQHARGEVELWAEQ